MNQNEVRNQLKNTAKDLMQGRYGSSALLMIMRAMLVMSITSLTLSISARLGASIQQISNVPLDHPVILVCDYLLTFLSTVIINIFGVGCALFFLNIACHKRAATFDLIYGFREGFGRSFIIAAVISLVDTIAYAPAEYILNIFRKTGIQGMANLAPIIAVAVVLLLLRIPVALGLSQCYFLMLDFPDYNAGKILKLSFHIMKGHKVRLFLIELSFVPLYLLCICTLGLGVLWVTPYINLVYALFFLDLMKRRSNP